MNSQALLLGHPHIAGRTGSFAPFRFEELIGSSIEG
jgi:hypothetical protein